MSFVEKVIDVIGVFPEVPDSVLREVFSTAGDMYVEACYVCFCLIHEASMQCLGDSMEQFWAKTSCFRRIQRYCRCSKGFDFTDSSRTKSRLEAFSPQSGPEDSRY
jgi:hypothetical protein